MTSPTVSVPDAGPSRRSHVTTTPALAPVTDATGSVSACTSTAIVPAGLGGALTSRSASARTVALGMTARPSPLATASPANSPVVVKRNEPGTRSVPDGTAHIIPGQATL